MIINIAKTPEELGRIASKDIAAHLNKAIAKKGHARLLLSTGASQFETLSSLVKENVAWDKVTMFHLDEYVALPESHVASFRKYLKERFVSQITLEAAYYVNGEGDIEKNIKELSDILKEKPIDVGVIGIGENGHIAFNDPPADFYTNDTYKVVTLDDRCKKQQVGEGWFKTIDDVPKEAITICVKQILLSKVIISCVPHGVKAEAIKNTLSQAVNPNVPATILKTHPAWHLYLDCESAKGFFNI
ncbi:MAG: glucosamine-6-phosphate deaminase [Fusobacteriaceae bacterium]|jgi:glucosamine-6-phosphate deaminase|nr:glucosamine-6-phosphate deaminase [Fusobacteriaceae bacterium]